ncbi:lipid-binding protein HSP12 TDEL_0C00880 [Torulaspora delbrueckii]|uniref:Uncharacterized protein n=1 Tax=Torulaspora delbrueckii TaxID=4950 RepID=G8ZR35_TORDE|nr:hypothetical protein TDEL_0C00880 [Torulaspora delbrueckii]CCE90977.1 hypothetical protein TDEL_0C00880 [Torulaspora delbrueckii]
MSDSNRKDFSTKIGESVKPDSQKSYTEAGKEKVTNAADRVAGAVQPESDKGVAQGVHDSAKKGKNDAQADSFADTAKEYVDAAKGKLNDAVEYVSSSVNGGEPSKK